MKHIGEVKLAVSIPIGTRTGVTSTQPDAVRCPKCRDAGFLRYEVPIGHPFFGRLSECDCKRREKEQRRVADLRRLSNLEAFLEAYDFDAFDPGVPGADEAYREAVAYARDPTGRWLLLHGNCGAGKTHLAAAIALRVMEQGKSVYFAVVPDLLDHLRSTFDPNSGVAYDQRFDDIRNAWLLVLDDLGTENTTPWAREKLYQIFNHRYNEQLPTVVTSNQDFKRIEERVLSRLLDTRLTRYVHVDAEDYRQRRRPAGRRGPRTED